MELTELVPDRRLAMRGVCRLPVPGTDPRRARARRRRGPAPVDDVPGAERHREAARPGACRELQAVIHQGPGEAEVDDGVGGALAPPCDPRTRDRSSRDRRDAHRSLAVRGAPREDPPACDTVVRGRPRPRERSRRRSRRRRFAQGDRVEALDRRARRASSRSCGRSSRVSGPPSPRPATWTTARRSCRRPGRVSCPSVVRGGPASACAASSSACAGLPTPEPRLLTMLSGLAQDRGEPAGGPPRHRACASWRRARPDHSP